MSTYAEKIPPPILLFYLKTEDYNPGLHAKIREKSLKTNSKECFVWKCGKRKSTCT